VIFAAGFSAPLLAETCNGLTATIIGTDGDDVIVGTNKMDVIVGLGGDDLINGKGGEDVICAGDGDDIVNGGNGGDTIFGGADDDQLNGEKGDDNINAGIGHDAIYGGKGTDVCDGDIGIDSANLCETAVNVNLQVKAVTLAAQDGFMHDGALFVPEGPTKKVAVLATHGAFGTFDSGVPLFAGFYFEPHGVTVLSLNRRDSGTTDNPFHLFEDATCDLEPGISFLEDMGYDQIYVIGHSKGTQMAAIYPSYFKNCSPELSGSPFDNDPRVAAVGTYGTVADGPEGIEFAIFCCGLLQQHQATAQALVDIGLGGIPQPFQTQFGFPIFVTSNSFLSYYGPNTLSSVQREALNLKVPYLLMHAMGDFVTPGSWSDRIVAIINGVVDVTYIDLPYFPVPPPGFAAHGFAGIERTVIDETFDWLTDKVPGASQDAEGIQVPDGLPDFDPPLRP
jgi:hypothetical protein